MTSYKFTGDVEEIFPFGLLKPGETVELDKAINHPRLEPAKSESPKTEKEPK